MEGNKMSDKTTEQVAEEKDLYDLLFEAFAKLSEVGTDNFDHQAEADKIYLHEIGVTNELHKWAVSLQSTITAQQAEIERLEALLSKAFKAGEIYAGDIYRSEYAVGFDEWRKGVEPLNPKA
jgi:uncharacterized small protein (DUF1192 family)